MQFLKARYGNSSVLLSSRMVFFKKKIPGQAYNPDTCISFSLKKRKHSLGGVTCPKEKIKHQQPHPITILPLKSAPFASICQLWEVTFWRKDWYEHTVYYTVSPLVRQRRLTQFKNTCTKTLKLSEGGWGSVGYSEKWDINLAWKYPCFFSATGVGIPLGKYYNRTMGMATCQFYFFTQTTVRYWINPGSRIYSPKFFIHSKFIFVGAFAPKLYFFHS